MFPTCETSEGSCAKAGDFKLVGSIDHNIYLEGPRCSEIDLISVRSRYRVFVCEKGGCKRVTERRKLRMCFSFFWGGGGGKGGAVHKDPPTILSSL